MATAMAAILVMMLMMTWQANPLEAPNIAPTRSSAKKNDWSYGTLKLVFDAFCIFLWVSDNTKFKIVFPKKETIEALNVTKGIPKDIKWPLLLVVERHGQTEWIIVQLFSCQSNPIPTNGTEWLTHNSSFSQITSNFLTQRKQRSNKRTAKENSAAMCVI